MKGPLDLEPKMAAMLGYIPLFIGAVLGVVFLATEKNDRFVRFHALQSLLLHGVFFVVSVVFGMFFNVIEHMGRFGAILGTLGSLAVSALLFLASMAAGIYMMTKINSGENIKLPVIGEFTEKNI